MTEYKRKPNTKCLVCEKEIYRRPKEMEKSNGKSFCSMKCYGKNCRKEKPCIVCGKIILSALNKKTCSRSCSNTNRKGVQYKINRPKDKVTSFKRIRMRLIAERGDFCQRCGYKKYKILEIHHRDRNRGNNEFENLEILCPNCHAEEHLLK